MSKNLGYRFILPHRLFKRQEYAKYLGSRLLSSIEEGRATIDIFIQQFQLQWLAVAGGWAMPTV